MDLASESPSAKKNQKKTDYAKLQESRSIPLKVVKIAATYKILTNTKSPTMTKNCGVLWIFHTTRLQTRFSIKRSMTIIPYQFCSLPLGCIGNQNWAV